MPLTEYQKKWALQQEGYDPEEYTLNDDDSITKKVQPSISDNTFQTKVTTKPDTFGWGRTVFSTGVREAAPVAAVSGIGIGLGAKLGAKAPGRLKLPATIIGGLAGGFGAGALGQKGIELAEQPFIKAALEAAENVDPASGYGATSRAVEFGNYLLKLKQSQKENPSAQTTAHLATIPLSGVNPSIPNLYRAVKHGVPWATAGVRPVAKEIGNIQNVGISAALGPAIYAGRSAATEEGRKNFNWKDFLMELGVGALFSKVNPIGRKYGLEEGLYRKELPDIKETTPTDIDEKAVNEVLETLNKVTTKPQGHTTKPYQKPLDPISTLRQAASSGEFGIDPKTGKEKILPVKSAQESAIDMMRSLEKGEQPISREQAFEESQKKAPSDFEVATKKMELDDQVRRQLEVDRRNLELKQSLEAGQITGEKALPYPQDFTKRQQKAEKKSTLESPEDLEMRRTESRLAGEERPKYSPEGKFGSEGQEPLGTGRQATTPFEKEMVSLYQKKGNKANINVWYNMLKSWGARMRNTKVSLDNTITDKQGNPVAGVALLSKGLEEATVKINPNKLSPETLPHELFHTFIDFLSKSARKGDIDLIRRAEKIISESPEFQDWVRRRGGSKPGNDANEFMTTEQGAEFMRRQLNLTDESAFKTWYKDFAVHAKNRFSSKKMTLEDYRRLLQYRFQTDAAFNKYFKTGNLHNFDGSIAGAAKMSEEGKFDDLPAIRPGDTRIKIKQKDGTIIDAVTNNQYWQLGERKALNIGTAKDGLWSDRPIGADEQVISSDDTKYSEQGKFDDEGVPIQEQKPKYPDEVRIDLIKRGLDAYKEGDIELGNKFNEIAARLGTKGLEKNLPEGKFGKRQAGPGKITSLKELQDIQNKPKEEPSDDFSPETQADIDSLNQISKVNKDRIKRGLPVVGIEDKERIMAKYGGKHPSDLSLRNPKYVALGLDALDKGATPNNVLQTIVKNLETREHPDLVAALKKTKTIDEALNLLNISKVGNKDEIVVYDPLKHEDTVGGFLPGDKVKITNYGLSYKDEIIKRSKVDKPSDVKFSEEGKFNKPAEYHKDVQEELDDTGVSREQNYRGQYEADREGLFREFNDKSDNKKIKEFYQDEVQDLLETPKVRKVLKDQNFKLTDDISRDTKALFYSLIDALNDNNPSKWQRDFIKAFADENPFLIQELKQRVVKGINPRVEARSFVEGRLRHEHKLEWDEITEIFKNYKQDGRKQLYDLDPALGYFADVKLFDKTHRSPIYEKYSEEGKFKPASKEDLESLQKKFPEKKKRKLDPRNDSVLDLIDKAVAGSFTNKLEFKDLVDIKKTLREQVNWNKSPEIARAINDKTLKPDAKFWQDLQRIYNRDFFPDTATVAPKDEPFVKEIDEDIGEVIDEPIVEKLPLAPIEQRVPVKEPPKVPPGKTTEEILTKPKELTAQETAQYYHKPVPKASDFIKPEQSKSDLVKQANRKMVTDITWKTIDNLRTPEKASGLLDTLRRDYRRTIELLNDTTDPARIYDLRNQQQIIKLQAHNIRKRFPSVEIDPILKFSEEGKFKDRPVEDNWIDETGVTLKQWREGVGSRAFKEFMEKENSVELDAYLRDEIKEFLDDPTSDFVLKFNDLFKKNNGLFLSSLHWYRNNPLMFINDVTREGKHINTSAFRELRKIVAEENPELHNLIFRSKASIEEKAYAHVRQRLRSEHYLQDDEIKEIFADYKNEGRKRVYDLDPEIGYIADIAKTGHVKQFEKDSYMPPEEGGTKLSEEGKFSEEGKLEDPFTEEEYKKGEEVKEDLYREAGEDFGENIKGQLPLEETSKMRQASALSSIDFRDENIKNLPIGRFNLIKGEVDKIADLEHPKAKKVSGAFTDFYREQRSYEGQLTNDASNKLLSFIDFFNPKEVLTLDNNDLRQVVNHLYDIEDKGTSTIVLTPRQKEIRKVVKDSLDLAASERAKFTTLKQATVNTLPHIPSRNAVKVFLNKQGSAEYNKLIKDWHDYYTNVKGLTQKQSETALEILRRGFSRKDSNLAKSFGFADKVAKLGLPRSWRETNLIDIMMRYNNRYARRLAYHKAIELNKDANDALTDPSHGLETNEHVATVSEEIAGVTEHEEAKRTALAGLVKAGMLGTLTGAKDFASNLTLGLQHQDPRQVIPAIGHAWGNMRKHIAESFQKGVNKPNIGSIEFGDGGIDQAIFLARRLRDILNTVTGRNHLERWTRATAFGQGKFLGMDNIMAAHKGNISRQGVKFLDDFGPKDWRNYRSSGVFPQEVLKEIAARYVESVQGTYDYRGLPRITQRGSLALPLSLARWNVEKFNNFVKYNVEPASRGNILPLAMSTLGMILGGNLVKTLVEQVTGRKEKTPENKEIATLAKEGKPIAMPIAYKLAALSSLSGYTGIFGDIVNSGLAYTYGKTKPQLYDNPLLIGINTIAGNAMDALEAFKNGDWEVGADVVNQIMEDMLQSYRLALPYISAEKKEDIDRANKMRDLKMFRITHGYRVSPASYERPNPFIDKDIRKFKRTQDIDEAVEMLSKLVEDAIEESEGNFDKLASRLNLIKQNSYQTMPNPERQLQTFAEYYEFLVKTQGQKEADKRLNDYLEVNLVNKVKAKLVPSL